MAGKRQRLDHLHPVVVRRARKRNGVITTEELNEIGLAGDAITCRVNSGFLQPFFRGVFFVGSDQPSMLARATAATLAVGDGAAVGHWSAGILWEILDVLPAPNATIELVVLKKRRRPRKGVEFKPVDRPVPTRMHKGVLLTTPLQTVRDLALDPRTEDLERVLANAQRRKLITPAELQAPSDHPGAAKIRELIERVKGAKFTRSRAERTLLALIRAAGLLEPDETNLKYRGREVDAIWHGAKVAVEVDSFGFHNDIAAWNGDQRLNQALELAGYLVIRTNWDELVNRPHQLVARLAVALATRTPAA